MPTTSYHSRSSKLAKYFDQTAVEAWARMTSDAPLSKIRETVRAGRNEMRACLLSMLPEDMGDRRLLDAGCGTGLLANEAANRGADVVAVDLSPNLVDLARERTKPPARGSLRFESGDMLSEHLGSFDHVVAMDSLIHYDADDIVAVLSTFAARTRSSIVFTVAPQTLLLSAMHKAGKLFPRSDRSPAIVPVRIDVIARRIAKCDGLAGWRLSRSQRVSQGFYTSQALELVNDGDGARRDTRVGATSGAST